MKITIDNVSEHSPHHYVAEASDLGLRPGEWPPTLETTLGNGQPFLRTSKKVADGDLIYVRYNQQWGCITLKIYND